MEQVVRQVNVAWSRSPVSGHANGAFHHNRNVLDTAWSRCILANRPGAGNLVKLLETPLTLERRVASPTKHNHWTLVDEGLRHAADRVCHARATHDQTYAWLLGKVANDSCGIGGGLLISEAEVVHVLDLEGCTKFNNWNANDSKHMRQALLGKGCSDDIIASDFVHIFLFCKFVYKNYPQ